MPVPKKDREEGRWFHAGKHTNWDKHDKPRTRRIKVLKSRRGNYLKAGRAMQALSNVSKDATTKREAGLDARYFFKKNAEKKK